MADTSDTTSPASATPASAAPTAGTPPVTSPSTSPSTSPPPASDAGGPDSIDLDLVVDEILVEAERRRAAGEYPEELLAEIDEEFRRWAPIAYRQRGIEDAIRAVESASFIDVEAPTEGARAGVPHLKRALKKATAFYHLHVARQVTALGVQVGRSLRLLAERLDGIDERVTALEEVTSVAHQLLLDAPPPVEAWVTDAVRDGLAGVRGRILVTDAGGGELVRDLAAARMDVHGVSASQCATDDALLLGGRPLPHLRAVPAESYGAVVLVHLEGTLTPANAAELVELAGDRTVPPGPIVVVATRRDRWVAERGAVAAELAAGPVLGAGTWAALLEGAGRSVAVTERDGVSVLWATS